jgi:histidine phosphotransfer protein HptB
MSKIDLVTFNSLKDVTGDDFMGELIETFLTEAPNLVAQLRSSLESQDTDTFRRAAHSLKSNAATFGAMGLSALARELEGFGRDKNLEIGDRLLMLEAEFQQVAEQLEALK